MLTADLVEVRRSRGPSIHLATVTPESRARALEFATSYLAIARAHVGRSREELEAALEAVHVDARDRKLAAGLRKLLDDRCTFESSGDDAESLRSALFLHAAAARRSLADDAPFDRAAILASFASDHATTHSDVVAIEANLYGDLRDAHRLVSIDPLTPPMLVEAWELARPQAVLLRALRVVVDVECAGAAAVRALFRTLKFLRLLHVATKTERGHRIEIDGPFALFEAQTRYGLQLAMLLPALRDVDRFTLEAQVRWPTATGAATEPSTFRMEGGCAISPREGTPRDAKIERKSPPLPDEIESLLESMRDLAPPFSVSAKASIVELPGVGLCVPDLVCEEEATKRRVYVEVMGYWSRDAVFRRVELVESGLTTPMLFCVSERLRVSEEVLDAESATLYVFKGKMSARTVIERVTRLMGR